MYLYFVSDTSAFAVTGSYLYHFVIHNITNTAMDNKWFVFRLKAPNDGFIHLTPDLGPPWTVNGYNIFIGGWGNSRSVIHRCMGCGAVVDHLHGHR